MSRLLAFLCSALVILNASAKNEKPNFLFIFADDMCYELIRELGHTDIDTPNLDRLVRQGTTFTHAYNMGLSERRATSVARYLESRGVQRPRIYTAGYGPDYPVADNSTDAGRQLNRRVELVLKPLT